MLCCICLPCICLNAKESPFLHHTMFSNSSKHKRISNICWPKRMITRRTYSHFSRKKALNDHKKVWFSELWLTHCDWLLCFTIKLRLLHGASMSRWRPQRAPATPLAFQHDGQVTLWLYHIFQLRTRGCLWSIGARQVQHRYNGVWEKIQVKSHNPKASVSRRSKLKHTPF